MNKWNISRPFITLGLLSLLAAACSSGADTNESSATANLKESPKDPVTLKFFINAAYLNNDEVKMFLIDPIKAKYPHVTLEILRPSKEITLETLISTNSVPDLHIGWNGDLSYLQDIGIAEDLDPLIKSGRFDLSRLDSSAIEGMRNEASNGHLYAIPYAMNFQLMYYNKDLMDRAGVRYPTDGMLWDQVIELSRQVSGKLGSPYKGLDINYRDMAFQLSLPFIDAATKKAAVTSDEWKKVLDTANRALKSSTEPDESANFLTKRNVAIWAHKNRNSQFKQPSEQGLNWDVAQFPSFADKPGISSQIDVHVVYISPTSKHKEDALNVIKLLTSDEVQTAMSRNGKMPALNNKAIINQYGADLAYLKDKNWKGVFQGKFGLPPRRVYEDAKIQAATDKAFADYSKGAADLNTALRAAAEQIDQMMKEKQMK
ncbi:extracellular solute-binding protein [Paenibacillus mesophilus]|uniref:ABC transporter substrate-binding protein n=1 Tax=Paenibacillus mesophilus TaxID=2582849 RepID=UPI00110DDF8D|nr:extracellular solute-binding protein [Paenibacillus mesophilus]TMV45609.1 extracellular solute-binding protein [Paenibacillus mesophilus]